MALMKGECDKGEGGAKGKGKLKGYDLYRALGSPKYVVAPMVDQSELAWRRLSRKYGAQLVYTPMINAKMFVDSTNKTYRANNFDISSGEEGAWGVGAREGEPATFPVPCTSSSSPLSPSSPPSSSPSSSSPTTPDTSPTPTPQPIISSSSTSNNLPSAPLNELGDRPLIVQFCANDPAQLLSSAMVVAPHCDAVDLNLGCPQDIAKKGRYGSFLMEDWELVYELVNTLHKNLPVPVTAKFRVFPSVEKTVEYAKMLERAGAQILTCHGRIREQRGQNTGLADWPQILAVKRAVSVPVFANGNILYQADVIRCLEETGCDGVMSAEGSLYNPAVFAGLPGELGTPYNGMPASLNTPYSGVGTCTGSLVPPTHPSSPSHPLYMSNEQILKRHPPVWMVALEYVAVVRSLGTRTGVSGVKGHLFKILRPALGREVDLRERLGRARVGERPRGWVPMPIPIMEMEGMWVRARRAAEGLSEGTDDENHSESEPQQTNSLDSTHDTQDDARGRRLWLWEYVEIIEELGVRLSRQARVATQGGAVPLESLIRKCQDTGLDVMPHWLCQPYFRKTAPQPVVGEDGRVGKDGGKAEREEKEGNEGEEGRVGSD